MADVNALLLKLEKFNNANKVFDRIFIETDVDPEDDITPGWCASVLFNVEHGETYLGSFNKEPLNAVLGLIDMLQQEGYDV